MIFILQHFPSKSEIREAYVLNNYSKVSLDELQSSSTFVSKNIDKFSDREISPSQSKKKA